MEKIIVAFIIVLSFNISCTESEPVDPGFILGYEILDKLNGHWVGSNDTAFGFYDWFAFDFRPISSSHVHSIYEGATNSNIITSVFLADFDGRQQIMARNGGWLGTQYRATYFIMDIVEENELTSYYRLVDAVGGEDRSFLEFRFRNDSIFIDAYKDNSGSLDKPIPHMGFAGANRNPAYAQESIEIFNFPDKVSEVNLNGAFQNLIDPDSALFLEEADDPFPRSQHGHLSELNIMIDKISALADEKLLFYLSEKPLVDGFGNVDLFNVDNSVVRTIDIKSDEQIYTATYLHPDEYYVTVFADLDENGFPSIGDYSSRSTYIEVTPESVGSIEVGVATLIQ